MREDKGREELTGFIREEVVRGCCKEIKVRGDLDVCGLGCGDVSKENGKSERQGTHSRAEAG